MKTEEFKEIVQEAFTQCCDLLTIKEKDYSDGKDRLVQFKRAAALAGVTPVEACAGMMAKHTTKLYTMLEDMRGGETFTREQFEETLNDHTNYLFLLKAILIDEGDI